MSMSKMSKLAKLNHAAGIYADMSVDGPAIGTLVAVVDRAKNLPNRKTMGKQNPYCAARLGKEAKKTDTDLRGGQTPKWDQELRFTVHESPDYFRLKLSVFNDDKRTDLIGETWVDLKDLIIPGGGQSDQWHPLQFRGKYAGEIRIEMTYYDTRPEDEAVIERRTQAAEKVHAKPSGSGSTPVNSSSLSGPRQLKDVKRRPLPSDPPGAPPRPTLPEKTASAPLPQQPPSRPVHHEPAPSAPPAPSDYGHHSRHPAAPEMPPYDAPSYAPPPASRPMRNYETPDDFHREWSQPAAPPPLSASKRIPQDPYYPSYREKPMDAYDSRSYARPRSGYGNMPPADYRSSRSDLPVTRADHNAPEPIEAPPVEAPRPSSHHSNYHFPTVEPYPPSNEMLPHGHGSRYRPRSSGGMQEPPLEYSQHPGQHPGPVERDHYYRPHSNSLVHDPTPMRPPPSRDGYHTEYATMQPRVEDEEDEGPPPPPPVHRSGVGHSSQHSSQQLVPSPTSPYQAYSPEYGSPHTSREITMTRPSHPPTDGPWMHDMPTSTPSMPPSLVAGFDPIVADAESDRAVAESHSRRQSAVFEGQVMPLREPSPNLPPYPVDPAPEDRTPVSRGSMSSETRIVPRKSVSPGPPAAIHRKSVSPGPSALVPRKSISPRPSSSGGHEPSQVPFSPDSFDAFNPNAARSAVFREPAPAYDSPAQAMEAARRSEAEAARDPGPIYDDEGKEIDPSDHLPTDTWAPEPERKNKKPGVVVRFRNAPARTATKPPVPAKEWGPPRGRPATMGTTRRPQSYGMPDMMRGRPPPSEMHRGRDPYGSYAHGRTYSTPNVAAPSPQSSFRGSASPGRSPSRLYEPENPGPPIPAKVPIAPPPTQSFPVSGSRGGMDALSRELGTIDIGSVGCNNGRAVRRYVPKITTGYAS